MRGRALPFQRVSLLAGATLLLLGSCQDHDVLTVLQPPDTVETTNIFQAAISEPVAPTARNVISANGSVGTVYVAFSVGELPHVRTVKIGNRSRATVAASAHLVVNGGLDPVSVAANVGDTLELVMTRLDGTIATLRAAVPAKRPPRVVRTDPPKGRTDVALNSRIVVVFSEPLDVRSVTSSSLRLLAGGQSVPGTFFFGSAPNVSVEFAPAQPLAPTTSYMVITGNVRDLSGDPMERADTTSFTTAAAPVTNVSRYQIAFVSCTAFDDEGECARTAISVINEDGSGETMLTDGPHDDSSPVWSPDGKKIAFTSNRGCNTTSCAYHLYLMNADGSEVVQLSSATVVGGASWSPDGRSIAFVNWDGPDAINIINMDGTNRRVVGADRGNANVRWSPDGTRLLYVRGGHPKSALVVIGIDGSNRIEAAAIQMWLGAQWSPDGRKIVYTGNDRSVHVIDRDGANDVRLLPKAAFDGPAQFSPDGRTIAFTTSDARSRLRAAVMNSDGSNVVMFGGFGFAPAWSADGSRIAHFSGDMSTGFRIVNVDGSGVSAIYTKHWVHEAPVAWSPLKVR